MLAILRRCHHNLFPCSPLVILMLEVGSSRGSNRVLVGVFVAVTVFKVVFLHVVSKSKRTTY